MVHTQLKQGVNEKVIYGRIDIQLSTEAVVCRFPEFFCHPTHGRRINDGSVKALPPKKPGTVIWYRHKSGPPADPNRNSIHAIWDFTLTVFQLSPQPLPPARGAMAFKFDTVVFCLAGVGLLLLSFYVVDAIQLNSNFVRLFGREVTEWGRSVVDRSHRSPPLTRKGTFDISRNLFCHMAIRVVAPLIWYPLLVLTLLVVARSSGTR